MVQLPPSGAFLDTQRIVAQMGIASGMSAADLGCGSGYITVALARVVGKHGVVSAVDVMQEPLETLRAKAEAGGFTNVREIRADLEVLGSTKLPDGSQDFSVLANVLFQSQKKDAIIAEAVRILKPGGRLVIVDWKKGMKGFGPPDELRTDEQTFTALATGAGVRFERTIDAGNFYIGLIFIK